MAVVDNLEIQIVADATKAEKAIDGLIGSLQRLNQSLDLGNLSHFTDQLSQIATASKGLKDVGASIRSIATAGTNLSKLTGMKTLTDEMKEVSAEAKKLAQETANVFKFDLSGKDSARKATQGIQEIIESELAYIKENGGKISEEAITGNSGIYSALIREASNYQKEIAGIYDEVKNFASGQSLYIDKATREWIEFVGRMDEVKKAFKNVSFDPSDLMKGYASIEDLSEELQKLGIVSGDTKEKIESVLNLIQEGTAAAAESVVHGSRQIEEGYVPEDYFKEIGRDLEARVREIYEKINANKVSNPFDGIIKGLQSLQGISIPDFSGLNTLVSALKDLIKINPEKIVNVVNALNGISNVSVGSGITQAAEQVNNALASITEESGNMANGVERGFELAIREVAALSAEIKERFSGDVVDNEMFLPSVRGMGTAFDEEANIIDADFAEIREEAKMTATDTAAVGEEAKKAGEKADNAMDKAKRNSLDLIARLVVLSHNFEKLASQLDRVANVGIKGLKLAFKPMDAVINEYREKINGIADAFRRFSDNAKKHLNKLSAFWKRSMKTFTFMLVRKAITAVITEVNDAVKSLALWSKEYGTVFNDSMSQITSNLSYMARSIVGAFEPLINFAVPAVNALADAVANAAAKLGEFFAALTGQDYYMKAVRQVTDYGESVEKAQKAQKNLIAGLDDLNIITTPTSTASGMDDLAGQWKKMNVSDAMKDWAKAIKNAAKILFEPIKKAWDRTKDYVVSSFKYMSSEIGNLFKDMATDFVKVWRQENTVKIFENLFNSIGHIATAIGNLAHNFDEAWNNADKGKKILENIRDIALIASQHIEGMARSFRDWAQGIDFNPILSAVENFTKSVQPLVDALGDVVESVWENVILKYHKWFIEEGAPHFLNTISNIINAFDFEKVKNDLEPVISAIETMMENIHTGITNAIGNIGSAVAEFANSEEFTKFCETVAWILSQVTAERVEKLFTALGNAILKVAGALIKFVGSDKFKNFIDTLVNWYDSKSADDIADGITKIAMAIGAIKLMKFVGEGMSGFLTFVSTLQALSGFKGVGSSAEAIAATGGAAGMFAAVAIAIAAIATAIYSFTESYDGIDGAIEELSTRFGEVKDHIEETEGSITNLREASKRLKSAWDKLLESLGNQKATWDTILDLFQGIAKLTGSDVVDQFTKYAEELSNAINMITTELELFAGALEVVKGVITGDTQLVEDGKKRIGGIKDIADDGIKAITDITGLRVPWDSIYAIKELTEVAKEVKSGTNEVMKSAEEGLDEGSKQYIEGQDGAESKGVNMGELIKLGVKLALGINSPSKFMRDDIAGGIAEGFNDGAEKYFPSSLTIMSKFGKDVLSKFTNGGANQKTFNNAAIDAIGGFTQGVNSKSGSAQNSVASLAKNVNNAFSREASANKFRGFANDIVNGFVNGINSFKNNVVGPMQDLARKAWESFKDWLGISSPSKVFSKLGYWTVEGFNKGIEGSEDSSEKAVSDWMHNLSRISVPQWDFSQAIPSDALNGDIFTHEDISGNVSFDSAELDAGMQSAFSNAIGGLILPYLNRIEEYSRETANKQFGITENQVGQAARNYAQDFQRRTGRPAYGAY